MPDPNLAQYSDPAPTQPLQDGPLSADPIPFEPPQFSAGQRAYLTAPYAQAPAPSPGMYDKFRQALSKVSAPGLNQTYNVPTQAAPTPAVATPPPGTQAAMAMLPTTPDTASEPTPTPAPAPAPSSARKSHLPGRNTMILAGAGARAVAGEPRSGADGRSA